MPRRNVLRLVFCLFASLAPGSVYAQSLEVGVASAVITPPTGTMLAGYGHNRVSTGAHDDLYAKAVVMRDRSKAMAIVTVDSIGLTRPDILMVQKAAANAVQDLDRRAVIISSTHTHAGPDVVGLWGSAIWWSGRDETYMAVLRNNIVQTIIKAASETTTVRSQVASDQVPLAWVKNLSEPDLLDPTLSVIQFVDAEGANVATLTNFACHPTILDDKNTLVSADYVSGFYKTMSKALPGEHLFLQGAIGGWVQPLQGDRSIELARQLGTVVADQSLELIGGARPNPDAELKLRHKTLDIPLDNWGFHLMMWLGVLDRPLFDGALRTEVAWFQIGDAEFVTHPGETSPAYSLASRDLMQADHSFVLGLTQDAMGYILKPDYFAEDAQYPHGDYLTSVSVGKQAGPLIMDALSDITRESE